MSSVRGTPTLMLVVAVLTSACGGGGGGDDSKSLRLEAAFDRSGDIYGDGTWFLLPSAGGGLEAGDSNTGVVARGVVSILLAPIPAGATIVSASLELRGFIASGNPFTDLGDLVMDHFDIGVALGFEDFGGGTLVAGYRTLPLLAPAPGPLTLVSLDVKSALISDIDAGRLTSSFRFQFSVTPPGPDGEADWITILANPDDAPLLPHVILTYR